MSCGVELRVRLIIGLLSATAAPAPGATYSCLEYGRASLAGVLVRQTYPGPPDYESFTKGDAALVVWILQLDTPTCVAGENGTYARLYSEREVQLVAVDADYAHYPALLGKRIVATGDLLPGGARHDKRLVLAVSELKKAPSRRQQ